MKPLREFERILMVLGCILLLVFCGSHLYSSFMSRAGIQSFRAHQSLPPTVQAAKTLPADSKIDFSLWNIKRIAEYKDALALKIDSPIAVLTIPKVGIEVPVYDGTDDLTLNRGTGRIEGTVGPGETGNMGIAGHRDGFFRGLKDIHVGDQVELSASQGKFIYKVDDIKIVSPSDVSVLRPRKRSSLTLVTCFPFYFVGDAPQRYIVHASLVD
jgi:sortase A